MPRPISNGLKYFQLDIAFIKDKKVLLAKEYIDPDGINPSYRLLLPYIGILFYREIYAVGYYLPWDNEKCLNFSNEIGNGCTMKFINNCMDAFFSTGFLSREMYMNYGILTSGGIQKRWKFISNKAKRKYSNIDSKYDLTKLDEDTLVSSTLNASFLHPKQQFPRDETKKNKKSTHKTHNKESFQEEETGLTTEETGLIPEKNAKNGTFPAETPHKTTTTIISKSIDNNSNRIEEEKENVIHEEIEVNSGVNSVSSVVNEDKNTSEANKHEFTHEETEVNSGVNSVSSVKTSVIIKAGEGSKLYRVGDCAYNYLFNKLFEVTRQQHCMSLYIEPEKITDWVNAFLRQLESDGTFQIVMEGTNGFCRYLKNWIKLQQQKNNNDPKLILTNEENIKNKHGQHGVNSKGSERIGGIKTDTIEQFRDRGRKRTSEKPNEEGAGNT